MKLSKLIEGITVKNAFEDVEVNEITDDSRKISPNCLFVCIKGGSFDGHSVAEKALQSGAIAVVTERDLGLRNQVIVENTRKAFAVMCAHFYGDPCKKLKLIGITGTNGKTTTAYFVKKILDNCGYKTGLLGTVKYVVGDREYPSSFTTPSAFVLHGLFREMVDAGCEYCVMEVSSMALEQCRVYGIDFKTAIFTNLTQDHLDYHITMENYLEAKKLLFKNCSNAVINADDDYCDQIIHGCDCAVTTFSAQKDEANYTAKNIKLNSDGIVYEIVGNGSINRVSVSTPGIFSVYNSMAAILCCNTLGIDIKSSAAIISAADGVSGRCEVVKTDTPYTIIIDYAHTPDALENILNSIRKFCNGRLITVFGCGGDRDKTKRPKMGKIASELSDIVFVTSDNPRTENPEKIIEDILEGIKKKKSVYSIENRREAIKKAMKTARSGDIILLAGKGHETYQILGTEKIDFDERKVIAEILKEI